MIRSGFDLSSLACPFCKVSSCTPHCRFRLIWWSANITIIAGIFNMNHEHHYLIPLDTNDNFDNDDNIFSHVYCLQFKVTFVSFTKKTTKVHKERCINKEYPWLIMSNAHIKNDEVFSVLARLSECCLNSCSSSRPWSSVASLLTSASLTPGTGAAPRAWRAPSTGSCGPPGHGWSSRWSAGGHKNNKSLLRGEQETYNKEPAADAGTLVNLLVSWA